MMKDDVYKPKYITNIDHISQLSDHEREALKQVAKTYVFRINDYYLSLIDWSNLNDPIRRIVIPTLEELNEYGSWDASDEKSNYVVPGCQHKYETTALLLVSEVCGAYCRYCFRKRLFRDDVKEALLDVREGIEYIEKTSQINNVLLTGGDPLALSTKKLTTIIERLRHIDHVQVIRLGTKMPLFYPMRIYEDEELLRTIKNFSTVDKRIYIMAHVDHPRELTKEAKKAFEALHDAGAVIVNQTPVLKGINDDPHVLAQLLDELSWMGITPYYFFINRPVAGNKSFVLPLHEVYRIVEKAKAQTSGLGKRVKLVMSHASGKIEILAIENKKAYLKYHQSRYGHHGKFFVLDCPDDATWFDDLPGSDQYAT